MATGILLVWVFYQTDQESFLNALRDSDKAALLLAFVPYVLSRISGALRLTGILNAASVPISNRSGLLLNWVSMFYGMFLPGGLGGDAYKLIRLKQLSPSSGTLILTRALLWDRLIGFAVLGLLTALFAVAYLTIWLRIALVLLACSGLVVFWLVSKRWLPQILPHLSRLLILSLIVQLSQILCIFMLLYSIRVFTDFSEYNLLFLISSVASILPISVGGVGVREVVFLKGAALLAVATPPALTVSILFDIIVTLTAVTGSIAIMGESRE